MDSSGPCHALDDSGFSRFYIEFLSLYSQCMNIFSAQEIRVAKSVLHGMYISWDVLPPNGESEERT